MDEPPGFSGVLETYGIEYGLSRFKKAEGIGKIAELE